MELKRAAVLLALSTLITGLNAQAETESLDLTAKQKSDAKLQVFLEQLWDQGALQYDPATDRFLLDHQFAEKLRNLGLIDQVAQADGSDVTNEICY